MIEKLDIAERSKIWIALSDLYLDTELQEYTYRHIAKIIAESSYTLSQVRQIDKTEVFPVLYPNMLSSLGVWDGFHTTWLIETIQKKIAQENFLNRITRNLTYRLFKKTFAADWEKIRDALPRKSNE